MILYDSHSHRELKSGNLKAYEMLLLVSLFPHGVNVEDLKFLEKKKRIPHGWVEIMESLTMFQHEGGNIVNRGETGGSGIHDLPEIGTMRRM